MSIVDIIIRTIDQSNTKSVVGKFTELNSAIMLARQGLEAMKKAYNFAKEGAQLDMTRTRFDRLAVSIGTTSDALLGDLKQATRGMYSDFELMANVTDLVGLGLANTHDEAIRLARVAGGLNMNMNQLVLTLTNMTTMRFDALGVSVDGFKGKVAALEKQGLSANEAFKEAFLQQAEAQLERVGEAADTTMGSFMRLEAQVKNDIDLFKTEFARGIEPVIKALADNAEQAEKARNAMAEYYAENYKVSKSFAENQRNLEAAGFSAYEAHRMSMIAMANQTDGLNTTSDAYVRNTHEVLRNRDAMQSNAEAASAINYEDMLKNIMSLQDGIDKYADEQADLNKELAELNELYAAGKVTTEEYEEQLSSLNQKFDENATAAEEWAKRFVFSMMEARLSVDGLTQDEFNFMISIGEQMGLIDEKTADMATGLNNAMENIDLSKPEEYTNLWQEIMTMPVGEKEQEKVEQINEAVQQIDASPAEHFRDVYKQIMDMPRSLTYTVNVVVNGMDQLSQLSSSLPGASGSSTVNVPGRASGGDVLANHPYWVGEGGAELFVPRAGGTIVPGSNVSAGITLYNYGTIQLPAGENMSADLLGMLA